MHIIISNLKDRVTELKSKNLPDETIRIMLKEILQDYILTSIYSDEVFRNMVFIGGTALRKLYSLNRFSEDIDFSVDFDVDYEKLGSKIINYFSFLDFKDLDYSIQQSDKVSRLTVKFKVLKDVGLSNYESEKLHIKVETTKGKIYDPELFAKDLVNTPVVIRSYPLATLMAGKIRACLDRTFIKGDTGIKIKGRDYYDLIWYMEKGIVPNEQVLLDTNSEYSLKNVFNLLDERVKRITKRDLIIDLKPFFESPSSIEIWCESFKDLYSNYRKKYK